MMKTIFGRPVARALIVATAVTFVAGPVTAAIWRAAAQDTAISTASASTLTGQLTASVTQTTGSLAGRVIADEEAQALYVSGLEGAIIASAATPEIAIIALEATLAQMKAAGQLPAPAEAAILQLLARIRAAMGEDAPAATGAENGLPAFGAPPPTGSGGGGPDYNTDI